MIGRLLGIPAALVTAPVTLLAQVLAILGDPIEVEEDEMGAEIHRTK